MKKAVAIFCMLFVAGVSYSIAADEVPNQNPQQVQFQEPQQQLQTPNQQKAVQELEQTQPEQNQTIQLEEQAPVEQLQPQPKGLEQPQSNKEEKSDKDTKIHPYIRADAGFTYTAFDINYKDKTQSLAGFQGMYNFAAGIKYKRTRFEAAYQERATMSDFLFFIIKTEAWVENKAVMANVFYDFVSSKYFALYIGGGLGVNMWNSEFSSFGDEYTDSGTSVIGGAYLGASINTPIGFSIDFGVDYFHVTDPLMDSFVPKIGARLNF
ncbi:MAG: outer membrane beta-barrel protein [Endomicrobiaceae bacterium]|nr:outer membrane beta-barrel protein [Endomicrobiaceae bacterium]